MSFSNQDKEAVRLLILDHYENPKFFTKDPNKLEKQGYCSANANSPSCIDNLTALIKVSNNKISDLKFAGVGCAISTSSTDLMCQLIKNKSIKDAKNIIKNYLNMIDNKPYDKKLIDVLNIYENVNQQVNRINCAKVGIKAINEAIENYEKTK